ncbi:hypothetical protein Rs2_35515 [Raphanus sativus]|nr:hypothetical protein Rs2_35515 [Raphanus sativus]
MVSGLEAITGEAEGGGSIIIWVEGEGEEGEIGRGEVYEEGEEGGIGRVVGVRTEEEAEFVTLATAALGLAGTVAGVSTPAPPITTAGSEITATTEAGLVLCLTSIHS